MLVAAFGLTSLLQLEDVGRAGWVFPVIVTGSGAGMWLLSRSDVSETMSSMVAISIAGMWVTVPETDMITILVGAAIPCGLATLSPLRGKSWLSGSLALSARWCGWSLLRECPGLERLPPPGAPWQPSRFSAR